MKEYQDWEFLHLKEAAEKTGKTENDLLREVASGNLAVYVFDSFETLNDDQTIRRESGCFMLPGESLIQLLRENRVIVDALFTADGREISPVCQANESPVEKTILTPLYFEMRQREYELNQRHGIPMSPRLYDISEKEGIEYEKCQRWFKKKDLRFRPDEIERFGNESIVSESKPASTPENIGVMSTKPKNYDTRAQKTNIYIINSLLPILKEKLDGRYFGNQGNVLTQINIENPEKESTLKHRFSAANRLVEQNFTLSKVNNDAEKLDLFLINALMTFILPFNEEPVDKRRKHSKLPESTSPQKISTAIFKHFKELPWLQETITGRLVHIKNKRMKFS